MVCDMVHDGCNYFEPFFALLPPNSLKNQNFVQMKKSPGGTTILHMCTKNYD